MRKRNKIDTPSTHIHDRSLSYCGTNTCPTGSMLGQECNVEVKWHAITKCYEHIKMYARYAL